MKKIWKFMVSLFLAIAMCMSVAGCDISPTKLAAPSEVRVENECICWDSVANSSGYVVRVNEKEERTTQLSYPISALFTVDTELNIKVKACGNNILYGDSDWSDIITYSYKAPSLPQAQQLSMPENVFVEDDVIYWDSVLEAKGYGIRINEKEDTVSAGTLSYPVSALISESEYLNIRIRALGDGLFTDSDWTDIISYRYEKSGSGSAGGSDDISSATDYGIGYGYNIIEDEYFSSSKVSTASILDLNEAANFIRKTQESTSLSKGIYAESIEEYARNYSSKIGANFELSGGFSAFSASLNLAFDTNQISNFSSKERQVYYTYFDNVGTYYYRMRNYNIDTLRGMLSDIFLNDLNRRSSATKNLKSDEELAQYLIDTYGTHLITGVQLGGRIEYSYLISTSDISTFNSLESALSAKFSAGVAGIVSGGAGASASELDECLKNHSVTRSAVTIRSYGGASVGMWNEATLNQNYTAWAKSLNREEYMNAVGLAPNGMVALWSLIPDTEQYHSLILTMETLFEKQGLAAYNNTIEKYTSHKREDIEKTHTITIDLSEGYESTTDSTGKTVDSFNKENIFHDNFNKEYGLFTLTGAYDGIEVDHYIVKGKLGLPGKDGHIIRNIIDGISFQISSEHDIAVEFQNIAFRSAIGFPAVYTDNSENKNIKVTIMTGGEVEIYGSDEINGAPAQPAVQIDAAECVFNVSGPLLLAGGDASALSDGADGIIAKMLMIEGGVTNSITVRGGNGVNGKDGKDGTKGEDGTNVSRDDREARSGKVGANGEDGMNGTNGGNAALVSELKINSVTITFVGGSGGNGGNGGHGGNGGNGSGGFYVFLTAYYHAGHGGNGGNGGNGGCGGRGGSAVELNDPAKGKILINGGNIIFNTGKCGNGGDGGRAGDGGNGGGDDWTDHGGSNGGNGGIGGKGGACYYAQSQTDIASLLTNNGGEINYIISNNSASVGQGGGAGTGGQYGENHNGFGGGGHGNLGAPGKKGENGTVLFR